MTRATLSHYWGYYRVTWTDADGRESEAGFETFREAAEFAWSMMPAGSAEAYKSSIADPWNEMVRRAGRRFRRDVMEAE